MSANCFSFWGSWDFVPRSLPGLSPWTPLGEVPRRVPWVIVRPQMKIPGAVTDPEHITASVIIAG